MMTDHKLIQLPDTCSLVKNKNYLSGEACSTVAWSRVLICVVTILLRQPCPLQKSMLTQLTAHVQYMTFNEIKTILERFSNTVM